MIQIYAVYWRHTLDSDPNRLKVKKKMGKDIACKQKPKER